MVEKNEIGNLKGKLNALSMVLKLGHEAFEKGSIERVAVHIVNNSRALVPFCRSAFVDLRHAPKVIAIMGQVTINHNSEYCLNLVKLTARLRGLDQMTKLTRELLLQHNAPEHELELVDYFTASGRTLYLIPFLPPLSSAENDEQCFWIVEFDSEPDNYLPLLTLLSKHYNEAFWFTAQSGKRWFRSIWQRGTTRKKWALAIILVLPMLAMLRVNQNIKAGFEIIPEKRHLYFAPYSGILKQCYFKNGERVKAGQTVISYKDEQLKFKLAAARNNLAKSRAEYERILHKSFTDKNFLGQLKLLKLQQQEAQIAIEETMWYLKVGQIKAKQDGILSIDDADAMAGKAVNAGQKLFEILTNDGMIAKITVDEKDAAVLAGKKLHIVLFLHTRPESPMTGKILTISPKPELTDMKNYCYTIKLRLPEHYHAQLKCGMRGIARISGDQVSLGYYLFKNLVLWWRTI